jgi:hypothetical protein
VRHLTAIWGALVLSCLAGLFLYQVEAGAGAQAPFQWPGGLHLGARGNLLMLVHPHCPCSRASLTQLASVLRERTDAPSTYVVFVSPPGSSTEWSQTDLWRSARALPGVVAIDDRGGLIGQRFGAATSGQVLFYDARGWLRFSGGLTPIRGHEGASEGMAALAQALESSDGRLQPPAPVYGCPLFSEEDEICSH